MPESLSSKSTIAKNTSLLYARTVLIMLVTLYTSRVILNALGVKDYGVYTAIGGIVSLLNVVFGPIDSAISRFLTFELGRGDKERLKRYFSTGLTIMIVFSLVTILILETIGLWFLNNKMIIDGDRMTAANWVLHLSIGTFVINMISSPYRASLISHEKMSYFAYIGIFDAILKLIVAILINYSQNDRLVYYALLLFIAAIIVRFLYTIVCNKEFEECKKARLLIDKELFANLFFFAGWNLFGALASVCRGQGINILFNVFGGPIVNAAFGIANQVNAAFGQFVNNFTTAINPSIIKSWASTQKKYMMSLIYQGAKYSFFLVLFFSLPILLETKYITYIWLGQTPDYSVPFIQLIIVHILIESFSKTIMAGTHATGKIKKYQIVVGSLQIIILPISYIILLLGFSPIIAYIAAIIIDIIALFVRIFLARSILSLSIYVFITKVLFVSIFTAVIAVIPPLVLRTIMTEGFFRFFVIILFTIITTGLSILYVGCTKSERDVFLLKLMQKINTIIYRN